MKKRIFLLVLAALGSMAWAGEGKVSRETLLLDSWTLQENAELSSEEPGKKKAKLIGPSSKQRGHYRIPKQTLAAMSPDGEALAVYIEAAGNRPHVKVGRDWILLRFDLSKDGVDYDLYFEGVIGARPQQWRRGPGWLQRSLIFGQWPPPGWNSAADNMLGWEAQSAEKKEAALQSMKAMNSAERREFLASFSLPPNWRHLLAVSMNLKYRDLRHFGNCSGANCVPGGDRPLAKISVPRGLIPYTWKRDTELGVPVFMFISRSNTPPPSELMWME